MKRGPQLTPRGTKRGKFSRAVSLSVDRTAERGKVEETRGAKHRPSPGALTIATRRDSN